MTGITFNLDVPQVLNLLLAVIFPVLVGLVTTRVTSSTLKAVLLATISLASGLVSAMLTAILAGVPFDIVSAFLTGFAAWIIALATHLGFWKPTGVTAVVQGIGAPPVAVPLTAKPGPFPDSVTAPFLAPHGSTSWTPEERAAQDVRDADVDAFNARIDSVDVEDIAAQSARLRRDRKV